VIGRYWLPGWKNVHKYNGELIERSRTGPGIGAKPQSRNIPMIRVWLSRNKGVGKIILGLNAKPLEPPFFENTISV